MHRIIYYNINYICNNDCLFCFSHNVGQEKREVQFDDFKSQLEQFELTQDDLVILNGGEPSIHSQFSEIIAFVQRLPCEAVVYSNGVLLDHFVSNLSNQSNIRFIVPIHGDRELHDQTTRVIGSYEHTIHSLRELQKHGIRYEIKFILNTNLIQRHSDLAMMLGSLNLIPNNVVFARINRTRKSVKNCYEMPSLNSEKIYFQMCMSSFEGAFNITMLDFPPCYLSESDKNMINNNIDFVLGESEFYFNDYNHIMERRDYKKERLFFPECKRCPYNEICDVISCSYYTLKYNRSKKNLSLMLE